MGDPSRSTIEGSPSLSGGSPGATAPVVLCVDDHAGNRYVRSHALRAAGFQVLEAANGREALRLAEHNLPALVVLDIRLPDIDGFDVCSRLKSAPATQTIPVLHVTAFGCLEDDLPAALEHESDAYLREPVEPQTLVSTARALIRASQAERRRHETEERARKDRDQAERELAAANARLRRVLSSIVEAYYVLDDRWCFKDLNAAAERHFNRPAAELLGKNLWELTGVRDGVVFDRFHEALRTGREMHFEAESRVTPGLWLDLHVYPCNGGLEVYFNDISARKAAEQALRHSEAVYRNLVETAFEGVWVVDTAGRTGFVNGRLAEMLKYPSPGDMIGLSAFDFVPDADPSSLASQFASSLSSDESRRYETRLRCRDGSIVWVSVSGSNLKDERGRVVGRMAVLMDITDRKRAGEDLAESSRRLELALEAAELGTWELDVATGLVTASARTCAIFDFDESRPTLEDWAVRVHPDDRARVLASIRQAIAGRSRYEDDCRLLAPDGAVRWVSSRAVPVADAGGRVARLVGITQDVTARKLSEEHRESQRELLEAIVENIPVMLCMYDPALRRFELNREAQRVLGWTNEDAAQGDLMARVYPDPAYRASVVEFMQSVAPGWRELETTAKDGAVVPCHWANVRLSDDRMIGIAIDLREPKRAERDLLAAVERYERQVRLFDGVASTTPDFVYLFDRQGRFLYANRRLLEVLGMKLEDVVGKTFLQLGYERSQHDMHTREIAQVIATKSPIKGEVPFKAPLTGIFGIYEYIFTPVLGPDGEVEIIAGTTRDVTHRKQAEDALRASEEHARRRLAEIEAIYESAPIGLCVFDTNLRFVRINKRLAEMNGLPVAAHIGRTPREVVPDVADQAERICRLILETGEPVLGLEIGGTTAAQPGVPRYWNEQWVPLKDDQGRLIGISVAAEEITEKKRAEEALRASEKRERARAAELETIMEAVPVAVYIARDRDCTAIVGNRMACDILGLPPGSDLSEIQPGTPNPLSFRAFKDGRELPAAELPAQKAARTGRPVRNFEHDLVFADGRRRTILGHATPLLGDDGAPCGCVGAFMDITERKHAEDRLRHTQKLESIGLLAGGIAHDFNNLLTGILGNASLVLDEVAPGPAERIAEIVKGAERAAHLTRQLLAYSGKGQFVVQDVDVSQALDEIGALVEFSIPKSVQLAVSVQRRLPSVRMDPTQLQQILMNLVINAGEAIGEGNPGRISISTTMRDVERPFVDAVGEEIAPGRYVCVEVADTGSGVPEDLKSKIFDPFFTTKFTGRGLGLAAVAGILRTQKGAIALETAPGSGAAFRVYLPVVQKPVAPRPAAGAVLVVDDEPFVRDFIGEVLRRRGYPVLAAADGREALSLFERNLGAVSAVVLDVVMPVMGAHDLLPKLKQLDPKIEILLTSGYSEVEARRLCAAFPGAAFIQKPYTATQILQAVEQLLPPSPSAPSAPPR